MSRERLNRFAPNLQRRCAWSLARKSLNVKVKGQGHQGVAKNEKVWHFVRERSSRVRSSAALRAVYVSENIFSSSSFSVLVLSIYPSACQNTLNILISYTVIRIENVNVIHLMRV